LGWIAGFCVGRCLEKSFFGAVAHIIFWLFCGYFALVVVEMNGMRYSLLMVVFTGVVAFNGCYYRFDCGFWWNCFLVVSCMFSKNIFV
jgi:hypothetical protein